MRFDAQNGVCNNCYGINKCDKECILHLGYSLLNFITKVDTTKTRIGEYSSRERGGKTDLICSGHKVFDLKSPGAILTDISTIVDISDKFLNAYGKNIIQIVNLCHKHFNISSEELKEITGNIKDINYNKLLVMPFKPNTDCFIDIDIEGNVDKNKEAKINYIKWETDKKTHKLVCKIGFKDINSNLCNYIEMDIKDYINKFSIASFNMKPNSSKYDKRLIKFSDCGIIKPIIINHGNIKLAVDGSYCYININNEIHIIGYWDNNNKLVLNTEIKNKAIDKIKSNSDFIGYHRKYIAPYLLYEPNIIDM